jgi:hypothetical protein
MGVVDLRGLPLLDSSKVEKREGGHRAQPKQGESESESEGKSESEIGRSGR